MTQILSTESLQSFAESLSSREYLEIEREFARQSPAHLAVITSGGQWEPARHLVFLNEKLKQVAEGDINRLIVTFPPRHGKSTISSINLPAWYLGKYPDKNVILVSYADEFAAEFGRKTRDLLDEHGERLFNLKIRQDSKSADRWGIAGRQGGMKTVGIGGGLLGRGADLAILDDVQQQDDAFSETTREKNWQWFIGTLLTRINAGGRIVVIMQRWHEADLVGKILERAKETGEHWEIFNVPAIAGENDAIGRKPGEALWPERFPISYLEQQKKNQGRFLFGSVYQQTPVPDGGGLFLRGWFRYYERIGDLVRLEGANRKRSFDLRHCRIVVCVDLAFSLKTEADWTVLICCAVTPDADLVVLDIHRERMTGDQLGPAIRNMMNKHNASYCGIEDVAAQTLVVQEMRRQGLVVRALKAQMDKISRSLPLQIKMESEQVYFPKQHPVLEALEHELLTFPKGAHDDLTDTLAFQALEAQRFGPAAIPPEEREKLDRERLDIEWADKARRDQEALSDWDHERWWIDSNWN